MVEDMLVLVMCFPSSFSVVGRWPGECFFIL